MQIESVWIVLAVVLVILELWAINRVRKSAGKGRNKGGQQYIREHKEKFEKRGHPVRGSELG